MRIEQVCGAVQCDDRLAGSGPTLDGVHARKLRPDDLVLFGLDRSDDVAEATGAGGLQRQDQGALATMVARGLERDEPLDALAVAMVADLLSTASSISEGPYDCPALLEGQGRGSDEIGAVVTRLLDRERGEWICIHDQYGEGRLVDNRLNTSFQRIPGGLYDTMIRPLPWGDGRSLSRVLAGWESLLWISLYGLAAYGLWVHGKGHRVLIYPSLLLFSLTISGAVTHGNLGTAFRHRGQICFVLAVLAMAGVQAIVEGRRVGRREGSIGTVSDDEYVDRDER